MKRRYSTSEDVDRMFRPFYDEKNEMITPIVLSLRHLSEFAQSSFLCGVVSCFCICLAVLLGQIGIVLMIPTSPFIYTLIPLLFVLVMILGLVFLVVGVVLVWIAISKESVIATYICFGNASCCCVTFSSFLLSPILILFLPVFPFVFCSLICFVLFMTFGCIRGFSFYQDASLYTYLQKVGGIENVRKELNDRKEKEARITQLREEKQNISGEERKKRVMQRRMELEEMRSNPDDDSGRKEQVYKPSNTRREDEPILLGREVGKVDEKLWKVSSDVRTLEFRAGGSGVETLTVNGDNVYGTGCGGKKTEIVLDGKNDERIVEIGVQVGKFIQYVRIRTSLDKDYAIGNAGEGGDEVEYICCEGEIDSFQVRSSEVLNGIVCYFVREDEEDEEDEEEEEEKEEKEEVKEDEEKEKEEEVIEVEDKEEVEKEENVEEEEEEEEEEEGSKVDEVELEEKEEKEDDE